MNWPITLSQDKCATDIIRTMKSGRVEALKALGFMPPLSGPWAAVGYFWRWGYTARTDHHLLRLYGPPRMPRSILTIVDDPA